MVEGLNSVPAGNGRSDSRFDPFIPGKSSLYLFDRGEGRGQISSELAGREITS